MGDFLRQLLGLDQGQPPPDAGFDEQHLAAAALMVEAARLDGHLAPVERARIRQLLIERLGLGPWSADRLLARAETEAEAAVEWHGFTTAIKQGFDHDGRIALVEMLWEVALADGELHDDEASLCAGSPACST